jgi:SAM-dependent methyltransferase
VNRRLLDLLRCPRSGAPLALVDADGASDEIEAGTLRATDGATYPIVRGVPRFVPEQGYTDSFGLQWNRFRRTQLDSHSGAPISRDRFYRFTGWRPEQLAGARVLDVGAGAGRFAEVALDAGATVVAVDASSAVEACRANLQGRAGLDVVQGDIYALPFQPGSFDFVYCLGVLQHTPDVGRAFAALPPMLRSGGHLAIDLYPKLWRNLVWPKYWLRPLTRRIAPDRLFRLVQRAVPRLLPLSRAVGRLPAVGRQLRRLVPVADYSGVLPLSDAQLETWAVLDTFDMLAPAYDQPQSVATVHRWFEQAGLAEVSVERLGFVVGRGTRP